jgi:hypothetical protein
MYLFVRCSGVVCSCGLDENPSRYRARKICGTHARDGMKIMFTSCRVSMPRNPLFREKSLFGAASFCLCLLRYGRRFICNNCVSSHPSLACNPAKGRAAGGEVCTNHIGDGGAYATKVLGMQVSEDCWPVGSRDQAVSPVAEPGLRYRLDRPVRNKCMAV